MKAEATAPSLEGSGAAPTYSLGIDVRTKDVRKLRAAAARLKSTIKVSDGGVYGQDAAYSIVWLDTTLTEDQLDAWLYSKRGVDYVGVFVRREIDLCGACPQYDPTV